ncbi:MAG: helix-turn-helix transcriptional regulator [Lachnospiraceae bacterium]|nr:helix-turn-helix transcriptional regulator [Lachnospiraceae bacterium]
MFNERLRSTRKLRKIKLQQMADMLEITLRAYQHYEQGERTPSLDCLIKIANILEVPTDYLLEREDYLQSLGVSVDEYL